MQIEFDPDKDTINRCKHGLSLAESERMNFDAAAIEPDRRYAYGEDRFQAHGLINGRLHVLIFTMRGSVVRAILLRKANLREVRRYDEKT